jgi:flagellar basal-body rod protein FlgF
MQSDSLYTTMAGLQNVNEQMQAIASNLSNANTPGYAAVQSATEAANYEGSDAPIGADVVAVTPGPDLTQGPLTHTNDLLNVGLGGDAWLTVQTANGTALTRDGDLSLSSAGILTDSSGNPILNTTGQPISLPSLSQIEIGSDGTISGVLASQPNGQSQNFAQIGLVSTPPGQLTPLSGSLYSPAQGVALAPTTDGSIHQGYLNGSNVDPTQSMMEMISESRSYQLQTDLMKSQSSSDQDLNALLAG